MCKQWPAKSPHPKEESLAMGSLVPRPEGQDYLTEVQA